MGFESYLVRLRGGQASFHEAETAILALPSARPDPDSGGWCSGYAYYVLDDGRHVIEIELSISPLEMSCRFTLCHPPSIDAVFLGVVRELMLRLGMEVDVCDDDHPEPFSLARFDDFAAAASRGIAAERADWIATCGEETMAASTRVAFQRFILPRCTPVVEPLP